jgi:hypothetical protein
MCYGPYTLSVLDLFGKPVPQQGINITVDQDCINLTNASQITFAPMSTTFTVNVTYNGLQIYSKSQNSTLNVTVQSVFLVNVTNCATVSLTVTIDLYYKAMVCNSTASAYLVAGSSLSVTANTTYQSIN